MEKKRKMWKVHIDEHFGAGDVVVLAPSKKEAVERAILWISGQVTATDVQQALTDVIDA